MKVQSPSEESVYYTIDIVVYIIYDYTGVRLQLETFPMCAVFNCHYNTQSMYIVMPILEISNIIY